MRRGPSLTRSARAHGRPTRCRDEVQQRDVASTNGAMSRYCEIDRIGVTSAVTRPTTSAGDERHDERPQPRDQRRGERRDDQEGQRRGVEPDEVREQQARRRPEIRPEPSQATASTRRTGTPSVAVISRSLASARIAVPRFV